jgi:hypothetical protein
MEINFGHERQDNSALRLRRDEMWGNMKDWLAMYGAIDADQEPRRRPAEACILMSDRLQSESSSSQKTS